MISVSDVQFFRHNRIVSIHTLLILFLCISLVVLNLLSRNDVTVWLSILVMALSVASFILFRHTKNYTVWSLASLSLSGIFFLFLTLTGGTSGSGLLWSLFFPYMAFHIHGHKKGFFDVCLFSILSFGVGYFRYKSDNLFFFTDSFMAVYGVVFAGSVFFLYLYYRLNDSNEDLLLLEESENRYFTLFDQVANIAVQGYDHDRKVIFWNKASEELFGYTREQAMGRRMEDLIITDSYRDLAVARFTEVLRTGVTDPSSEIDLRRADGQLVHVFTNRVVFRNNKKEWEVFRIDVDQTDLKKAQQSLRESDLIFKNAVDLMCIMNSDFRFLTINPTWSKVLGWTQKELESFTYLELIHPDDMEATSARLTLAFQGGNLAQNRFENRFRCKDGSCKWFSWKSHVDLENHRLYGIAREITAEKEIKEKLRESEEKYRLITENTSDCISIYNLTQDRFTYVSPSVYSLRGITPEEAIQETLAESLTPESYQNVRDAIQLNLDALNSRETSLPGDNLLELQQYRKDGQAIWIEVSLQKQLGQGGDVEFLCVSRNIDVRKKMELEHHSRNEFQRMMADISTDFIHVTPEDFDGKLEKLMNTCGTFLNVDRACFLRYETESGLYRLTHEWCRDSVDSVLGKMLGIPISDVHWPEGDAQDCSIVFFPDVQNQSESCFLNLDFLRKCEVRSMLILPLAKCHMRFGLLMFETIRENMSFHDAYRDLLKVLLNMLTDVLDKYNQDFLLRENAQQLSQINVTKDKIFSIIAHDLRSPFQTFLGLTELMAQDDSGLSPREMRNYSQMMYQQALGNYHLLENLLEWSRLQRGTIRLDVSEVLLSDFFNSCASDLKDAFVQRSIALRLDVSPALTGVFDRQMMSSVVRNLVSNSLKFTDEEGVVLLGADKTNDGNLMISVTDTGIGIPPEMIPNLFTINDHKGRRGLNGEKSTGLGLVLCKEFIDVHHGSIRVESKIGLGCTFIVELPQ